MTTLSPYVEKIVSDFLRSHDSVEALGARVVGKTPENTETPWVRVTQIGGFSEDIPDHFVSYLLQLDCYAGAESHTVKGQPGANLLQRTVRAALTEIGGVHGDAVVSGAQVVNAARVPDDDFEEQRERFVLTVNVWAHS